MVFQARFEQKITFCEVSHWLFPVFTNSAKRGASTHFWCSTDQKTIISYNLSLQTLQPTLSGLLAQVSGQNLGLRSLSLNFSCFLAWCQKCQKHTYFYFKVQICDFCQQKAASKFDTKFFRGFGTSLRSKCHLEVEMIWIFPFFTESSTNELQKACFLIIFFNLKLVVNIQKKTFRSSPI